MSSEGRFPNAGDRQPCNLCWYLQITIRCFITVSNRHLSITSAGKHFLGLVLRVFSPGLTSHPQMLHTHKSNQNKLKTGLHLNTRHKTESRREKTAPEYPTAGGNVMAILQSRFSYCGGCRVKSHTIIPTDSQPAKDASCNNSTEDFQAGVHNHRNLTNVSK